MLSGWDERTATGTGAISVDIVLDPIFPTGQATRAESILAARHGDWIGDNFRTDRTFGICTVSAHGGMYCVG